MTWRAAVRHLRRVDPVLARVIDVVGPCRFRPRSEGTHFDALVRAIVYQQLSGKAAATIHARLLALYGGRSPTPEEILGTADAALRAAGLSRQKSSYLQDLAARTVDGRLPLWRLGRLSDEEILSALTAVKGVGRWTAQMFLLFRLGRPNVLPDGDLGIRKAIQRAYGLVSLPTPRDVRRLGSAWDPYCSVAAWYLWRFLGEGFWA